MIKLSRFFLLIVAVVMSSTVRAQWVCSWATAAEFTGPSDMPASPLTNRSLREIVHVTIGGDCFRLRLSNEFSKEPVEIKNIYVADALDSCDINARTAKYLTFSGKKNVTIEPGKCVVSDVCKYNLKPLQLLSITICYGATPVNATSHRGSRTTSYLMDGVSKPQKTFATTEKVLHWYNIAAIDVPAKGQQCVAVLGNSITDGRGSTNDLQNRWPDKMAEALAAMSDKEIAVANLGIGGNCVVAGGLSEPALKRFDRDILGQEGITSVIIFEGVNDIGGSKGRSEQMAKQLIEAYQEMIAKIHARGMKVYLATITPFGKSFYDDTLFKEAARQTVNQWIRTNTEADGYIDFDELMRDPEHPNQLRSDLQEDWLHPNAKGYEVMGEYAAKCMIKL